MRFSKVAFLSWCGLIFLRTTHASGAVPKNEDYIYDDEPESHSHLPAIAPSSIAEEDSYNATLTPTSNESSTIVHTLTTIVISILPSESDGNVTITNQTTILDKTTAIITTAPPVTSIGSSNLSSSQTDLTANVSELLRDHPESGSSRAVGNGSVLYTTDFSSVFNVSTGNETGESVLWVENGNFTSESGGRRFLVPANFSEHEIVDETNVTAGRMNSSDSVQLINVGSGNDGVNITTAAVFNVSQGGNGTANVGDFPIPSSFHGKNVTAANITSVEFISGNQNVTGDGAKTTAIEISPSTSAINVSAYGGDISNETMSNQSITGTFEGTTIDHTADQASTTLTTEIYDWESAEHDAVKGDKNTCLHRSSETLSDTEFENLVVLRDGSASKWTNESEAVVCHFLLKRLCQHFKRFENVSSCEGLRLDIIDEPHMAEADLVMHLLARGPGGDALHAKVLMGLLQENENEIRAMLAVLFFNATTKDQRQTAAPVSTRPYEHPLDNPVIATSLIAVVVTVCLVAMLSLLILVLLQRRRRSRKGEWIVNKKDRGLNGSAHQAYGWCFENDAYANDEKKRPMAPSAPAQLLDDRRQRVDLPVDSPSASFDVSGSNGFPVPPPPPLNSFNGCSNGIRANKPEQLAPPPPSAGSSFSNWGVGEAMEMTETGPAKNQRWY